MEWWASPTKGLFVSSEELEKLAHGIGVGKVVEKGFAGWRTVGRLGERVWLGRLVTCERQDL